MTALHASIILATVAISSSFAQQKDEDYIVRSNANLVLLDVSVLGSGGIPVSGLQKDRFSILEDGRKQLIKQFAEHDTPVSMGFVIDMSGSMESKVGGVQRAVNAFLNASNPDDEYFLVGFNDRPKFGMDPAAKPFTKDRNTIRSAMYGMSAQGRTSLYDALDVALDHVSKSNFERRFLVLISDGRDTASKMALDQILFEVRTHPVTVFTIGLFAADDVDQNSGVLKQLAKVTGGRYFNPLTVEAIESACLNIARDIRARYTLAYTPPEDGKKGLRRIRVELNNGSGSERQQRMTVRARTEYLIGAVAKPANGNTDRTN